MLPLQEQFHIRMQGGQIFPLPPPPPPLPPPSTAAPAASTAQVAAPDDTQVASLPALDDPEEDIDEEDMEIIIDEDPVDGAQEEDQLNLPGGARATRNRSAEGDIAIAGPAFLRLVMVDVHIISPFTVNRLKAWGADRNSIQQSRSIKTFMDEGEKYKRSCYAKRVREFLPPNTRVDIDDPLAALEMEMLPAVMTPFGNMSAATVSLITRLAQQQVDIEVDNNITPAKTVSDIKWRLRVKAVVNKYKSIIAAGLARSVAITFSQTPQHINVPERWGIRSNVGRGR